MLRARVFLYHTLTVTRLYVLTTCFIFLNGNLYTDSKSDIEKQHYGRFCNCAVDVVKNGLIYNSVAKISRFYSKLGVLNRSLVPFFDQM